MEGKVQVMIVEDESIVAMDLSMGLQQDGYHVVGVADNYEEAIDLYKNNEVDILLMDIHIYGNKDGVETATDLMKIKEVPLIYLTAFTDAVTVERVKHTRPAAFLTKPYNIENVRIAIDLALYHFASIKKESPAAKVLPIQPVNAAEKKSDKEQFLQLNEYLFIKQNYRFVKFKLAEIQYIEANNNYVQVVTKVQKFSLRIALSDLLTRLDFSRLIRIHRSYAVNIDAISSFDDQLIHIEKHELPIGRNYREDFLNHFNLR